MEEEKSQANCLISLISLKTIALTTQKQRILRRVGKNTQENCTKKSFTTKIITMV